jgi:hypothetical protein
MFAKCIFKILYFDEVGIPVEGYFLKNMAKIISTAGSSISVVAEDLKQPIHRTG